MSGTTPAADAVAPQGFADLIRQRDFMRLWVARIVSTLGQQMLMVAVGWQMYDLTGSAWDLGLVGLYQFAPALLLTLVAGHVADNARRDRIIGACLLLQGVASALLIVGTQEAWVSREILLGLSVLLGVARAFQQPAVQSLTPGLLPPLLLSRGMAFASAGGQCAIIGGPALGGLLYVWGASAVYGACAVAFGVAAAVILSIRAAGTARTAQPMTLQSVFAGVSFVWQRKVVLGAISLDLFAVLLGGATALLPMFAKDILHVGPVGLGFLRGAPAVGALAMSLCLTRWPLHRQAGRKLLAAVALFGVCMIVFGLSTSFWLSLTVLAVSGAADTVSVVVRQTLVQAETPDEMRGRVSAVSSIFIGASNQLGEFESGATAALLGPIGSVVLGGVGTVLVAVLWTRLFVPLVRHDRL